MFETLMQLDEDQLAICFAAFAVATAALTFLATVLAVQWRKVRQRELDLTYRNHWLEKGLSVEQIVTLLTGRTVARPVPIPPATARAAAGATGASTDPSLLADSFDVGRRLLAQLRRALSNLYRQILAAARRFVEDRERALARESTR